MILLPTGTGFVHPFRIVGPRFGDHLFVDKAEAPVLVLERQERLLVVEQIQDSFLPADKDETLHLRPILILQFNGDLGLGAYNIAGSMHYRNVSLSGVPTLF